MMSGTARDDRGTPNGSMGVDAGDPEHSGRPSLWVTNYENELHALYRNDCKPGRPLFQFRTAAGAIARVGPSPPRQRPVLSASAFGWPWTTR